MNSKALILLESKHCGDILDISKSEQIIGVRETKEFNS